VLGRAVGVGHKGDEAVSELSRGHGAEFEPLNNSTEWGNE